MLVPSCKNRLIDPDEWRTPWTAILLKKSKPAETVRANAAPSIGPIDCNQYGNNIGGNVGDKIEYFNRGATREVWKHITQRVQEEASLDAGSELWRARSGLHLPQDLTEEGEVTLKRLRDVSDPTWLPEAADSTKVAKVDDAVGDDALPTTASALWCESGVVMCRALGSRAGRSQMGAHRRNEQRGRGRRIEASST